MAVAKPCKRGHFGRDSDGHCSECRRLRLQYVRENNAEGERERSKRYRKKKGNQINEKHRKGRIKEPGRYRSYGLKYRIDNPERTMLRGAVQRAKQGGYACTITEIDIFIPECCPLLGIKLQRGTGKGRVLPNSPTLDKIIPALGYVPGNVMVISHRANSIKRDATLEELQALVQNWERRSWELTPKATGMEFARVAPLAEQA